MTITYTATYSPEDNKLRLYASQRLDATTYERVKAAGFKWAPAQELFVAPMWTPWREDLLEELAGEIGDEDTSLVERAEERADRFEDYSVNRKEDAERAHSAVSELANGIPLGQPILVGHHSERRARKDAEKIQRGMERAVKMWRTSEYWTRRAAGAISHAKYKELPAVRARRIKGIEADLRKRERSTKECEDANKAWNTVDNHSKARLIANYNHVSAEFPLSKYPRTAPASQYEGSMSLWSALGDTPEEAVIGWEKAKEIALRVHTRTIENNARWIEHYTNRLTYERAMLTEQGGLKGEQFEYLPGGQVLRRGSWYVVVKANKRGGVVTSVSVLGHFARSITLDEITDYKPPADDAIGAKVKAATDKGPMCNYPGEGFEHLTEAEWKRRCYSDWDKSKIHPATETHGKHRTRACKASGKWSSVCVYLTDKPRKDPPPPSDGPKLSPDDFKKSREPHTVRVTAEPDADAAKFEQLAEQARAGVRVVSAPQLFPTPDAVARRLVELAEVRAGQRVLEPSAGTGALVRPIAEAACGFECFRLVTVEINAALCTELENARSRWLYANETTWRIHNSDFLELIPDPSIGFFDRVVMNPPFENASDIEHIEHAVKFLKPGGILAAICAAGPRQAALFNTGNYREQPCEWYPLPAGSFESSGTNVNTAIVVIRG